MEPSVHGAEPRGTRAVGHASHEDASHAPAPRDGWSA